MQLHDTKIPSTKSGYMDPLITEAIKLELQLNNKKREDGLKLCNSWKPLTQLLKRKCHTSCDSSATTLPIPVFIILYVYTPSSLGTQSLSIAFPPDNTPPPLLIPTTILILLISPLLPLTYTIHCSVSGPSTFLSPSFLRTNDNTLSLVG
jgi:hypothetical protein